MQSYPYNNNEKDIILESERYDQEKYDMQYGKQKFRNKQYIHTPKFWRY